MKLLEGALIHPSFEENHFRGGHGVIDPAPLLEFRRVRIEPDRRIVRDEAQQKPNLLLSDTEWLPRALSILGG